MPEAAVEVKDLTVRFGDFTAVDNISFRVERGEIFGFLGANGAGKTTTIRVLCGLLEPASGQFRVAGLSFDDDGGRAIKRKVGYMSQRFTLFNDLTIDENLTFIASLHRMDPAAFKKREAELLDFIGFRADRTAMVSDLPGGEKQVLSLVAALLHGPEVVFLDEPTAGVSPAARKRFWQLIRQLSERGITVFVTTHYMDEAEECGRIALMRAGRIIALDTPAALKKETFPEALVELDFGADVSAGLSALKNSSAVQDLRPHGARYHARLYDRAALERLALAMPGFSWKAIAPSLEDVFVRLVEGADR